MKLRHSAAIKLFNKYAPAHNLKSPHVRRMREQAVKDPKFLAHALSTHMHQKVEIIEDHADGSSIH